MMTSPEEIKYCLDSNFIIALLRGRENAVRLYQEIKNAPLTIASIASMVLFEILRGDEKNPEKIRRFEHLRERLEVLPFGEREAEVASEIDKMIRLNGFTIAIQDLLIGATAKTNNAILVSNDTDYERIEGLQVRKY